MHERQSSFSRKLAYESASCIYDFSFMYEMFDSSGTEKTNSTVRETSVFGIFDGLACDIGWKPPAPSATAFCPSGTIWLRRGDDMSRCRIYPGIIWSFLLVTIENACDRPSRNENPLSSRLDFIQLVDKLWYLFCNSCEKGGKLDFCSLWWLGVACNIFSNSCLKITYSIDLLYSFCMWCNMPICQWICASLRFLSYPTYDSMHLVQRSSI
jgi:hypothetical protein